MGMAEFIANKIIEARKKSLEAGQAKYRAYFVTLPYYKVLYKKDVDAILVIEDCADCIVTE